VEANKDKPLYSHLSPGSPLQRASDLCERAVVPFPRDLPVEMVSEYLDGCRKDLFQLRAALATSDYELARRLGHQMKATGSPYGFPDLTQIGSSIERTAADRSAELESHIDRLEAYLNVVEISPE
jgi:histidine phosphotransfer protein HptB